MRKLIFICAIVFLSSTLSAYQTVDMAPSQSYQFILTHMLGKKLQKPAYFTVGNQEVWILDFRNGDKIYYTIKSMNESNPLCGVSAKVNLGDYCQICITKLSGDNTNVEFNYGGKRISYTGYLSR